MHLHMLHGIFKQHQVHCRVELVVGVYRFSKNCLQVFPVLHWHVTRVLRASSKVAINKGLLQQHALVSTLQENTDKLWDESHRRSHLGQETGSHQQLCAQADQTMCLNWTQHIANQLL